MSTPRDYYKKYKKLVWIALGVAVVILGFLITAVLQGYQMERINSWLKPLELENIYSSSWQLVNSLIAFTDGGIFGLGLGNSIQKSDYIPEAHNDFIGAIIYEELGIFGLALMIIPKRMCAIHVLDYDEEGNVTKSTDYALANPKIVSYTPKQSYLKTGEACLSVPEDVKGYVPRHAKITVEGFDVLTNKDVKIVARGFLAICLQHELDHFDGVLYYDHINKE